MGYRWDGMNILSWTDCNAAEMSEGLVGYFLLYPDGTESLIEDGYSWEDIKSHYEKGGQVGKEKQSPYIKSVHIRFSTDEEEIRRGNCFDIFSVYYLNLKDNTGNIYQMGFERSNVKSFDTTGVFEATNVDMYNRFNFVKNLPDMVALSDIFLHNGNGVKDIEAFIFYLAGNGTWQPIPDTDYFKFAFIQTEDKYLVSCTATKKLLEHCKLQNI